jgi:acyl-CoA thioesterase-1
MVGQGYFERFLVHLEERWPDAKIRAINAGIPGDTVSGGLRRIDGVLAENPDLVLVQFGLNDLFSGVDLESFATSYELITKRVIGAGALPLLVVSSPLPHPPEQENATRYYDVIRKLGQQLRIPVADTDLHFRNAVKTHRNPDGLYLDDGSHPSDAGHSLMAEALGYLFVESS